MLSWVVVGDDDATPLGEIGVVPSRLSPSNLFGPNVSEVPQEYHLGVFLAFANSSPNPIGRVYHWVLSLGAWSRCLGEGASPSRGARPWIPC